MNTNTIYIIIKYLYIYKLKTTNIFDLYYKLIYKIDNDMYIYIKNNIKNELCKDYHIINTNPTNPTKYNYILEILLRLNYCVLYDIYNINEIKNSTFIINNKNDEGHILWLISLIKELILTYKIYNIGEIDLNYIYYLYSQKRKIERKEKEKNKMYEIEKKKQVIYKLIKHNSGYIDYMMLNNFFEDDDIIDNFNLSIENNNIYKMVKYIQKYYSNYDYDDYIYENK